MSLRYTLVVLCLGLGYAVSAEQRTHVLAPSNIGGFFDCLRTAGAMARVVFITYSTDAAVRVHQIAPEMMLSVSIESVTELAALEDRKVDLTRVLAWTGTATVNADLNRALAARGVEAMFGTLGNPDRPRHATSTPTTAWKGMRPPCV
jgi:hypothetical protein